MARAVPALLGVWEKIPVAVRAIPCGLFVMYLGIMTFEVTAALNERLLPQLRWAPFATLPLLWLYWRYFAGAGWPKATSEARRRNMRAHLPPRETWAWTVAACVGAGLIAFNLIFIWQRVVDVYLPSERFLEPGVAWWAQLPTLLIIALVAGTSEEVGARGYLQTMVERRHGPAIAIFLSAATFTVVHFNHFWGPSLAFAYFFASLWFGLLTYVSGSILPMVAVHVTFDAIAFTRPLFFGPRGREAPLAETGLDAAFWFNAFWLGAGMALMIVALFCIAARRRRPHTD